MLREESRNLCKCYLGFLCLRLRSKQVNWDLKSIREHASVQERKGRFPWSHKWEEFLDVLKLRFNKELVCVSQEKLCASE